MASSAIDGIYNALAAATVTYDSSAISGTDADQLPQDLTGKLPARLLTPLDPRGRGRSTSDSSYAAQDSAGIRKLRWTIYDILFAVPINQTEGLAAVGKELLLYMGDYDDMVSDITSRLTTMPDNTTIMQHAAMADVMEWPVGSGKWFFGVHVELTIDEVIC